MAAWSDKSPNITISNVNTVFGEEGDITSLDYIKLSTTSPDNTQGVGSAYWDTEAGTWAIKLQGGNVTLQVGQEQNFLGLNKTGSTLNNGSVVYYSGAQGNRPTIANASNAVSAQAEKVAGIITETILNNGEGFVTTAGIVHDLDTSTWVAGDYLYVGAVAGTLTNVRPIAPAFASVVGIVLLSHITQGMIYVDITRSTQLNNLHDVLVSAPTNEQMLAYDSATGLWKNVRGVSGKSDMTGFPVDASGNYLTTLTYNETTRTVTITPTAASFDVFVLGTKYTKTGAQSIAHSAVGASQFVYYDETGTLVTSSSPWDLLKHAPVCFIFQDVTNSRRIPFEERHHAGRDLYWHRNQHSAEGTKATGSGFQVTGYTLNVPGDAANTFAIASGRIEDEDIRVDTEVVADGGPYLTMHRSGASGDWLLTRTNVVPFLRAGTNIQYNQNTGATWQLTTLANNNFVNYYIFGATALPAASISPAPGLNQQYVLVPGQAVHAAVDGASAETIASIAWGSAPFQEIVPLYKLTFLYQSGGGGTVELRAISRIVGTSATITAAAQTDHGALSGLADLDHPASAIINSPSGNLAATNVQAALNELQSDVDLRAVASSLGTMSVQNANAVAITGGSAQFTGLSSVNNTLLVGTTVDDGTNNVQVTGNTKLTGDLAVTGFSALGGGALQANSRIYTDWTAGSTTLEEFAFSMNIRPNNASGSVNKNGIRGTVVLTTGYAGTGEFYGVVGRIAGSATITVPKVVGVKAIFDGVNNLTATNAVGFWAVTSGTAAVTNVYGVQVAAHTTGTNAFGLASELAAGATRWNLYCSGTAKNYMSGSLLIGSTTDDGINKLQVTGAVVNLHSSGQQSFKTASNDSTVGNNAGLVVLNTASSTSTVRQTTLYLDANGGNGIGGDYAYLQSLGDFTFNIATQAAGNINFLTAATQRFQIGSTGRVTIAGNSITIATAKTPASAADTGTTGDHCWDANFLYVCTATNTWKRAALATW